MWLACLCILFLPPARYVMHTYHIYIVECQNLLFSRKRVIILFKSMPKAKTFFWFQKLLKRQRQQATWKNWVGR